MCAQKAASGSPRLDQVCDHVHKLMAEGSWTPRYETFPLYQSPLPEFSKERKQAINGTRFDFRCLR